MNLSLVILFFLTALVYACVGFGGGSTYTALLVLVGVEYQVIPVIALLCNLAVVSINLWRFKREQILSFRKLFPFLIASFPAAWIGGRVPVSEQFFTILLGLCLLFAGLRMLWPKRTNDKKVIRKIPPAMACVIGAVIGGISGLVGIGGGIILSPILYALSWGSARQIAGACSLFIFVNSVSGLGG